MGFIIALLTVVMVLDCALLVLLVLMQLPKKEAGAGLAFGGAATDALFGAGSGNFLTKATKYAAGIFFVFAIVLSVLQIKWYYRNSAEFRRSVNEESQRNPAAARQAQPATTPVSKPTTTPEAPADSGGSLLIPPAGTNATPPK